MESRNISIASKNGYTYEKVMKAKKYLEEIGTNRRNFDFKTLVSYYNEILGTHEVAGCKCQAPKYYNGLQNYFKYGKLTLINNGLATEEDFELKEPEVEPIAENRINLGEKEEIVSEPSKDEDLDGVKEEEKEEVVEPVNEVNSNTESKKRGRKKNS